MLADLKAIVEQESPSGNVKLLNACAGTISGIIERRTGIRPSRTRLTDGSDILSLSIGPEQDSGGIIVLSHYDTVFPAGTLERIPFSNDEDILRGPGVFDMKTGIIQGIWALKFLIEQGVPGCGIRFLFTPDEETGSQQSGKYIEEAGSRCRAGIVLEPSENGRIKTGRKGVGTYNISITGRSAHAGLHPEEGINAIAEIARIVIALQAVQDIPKGTTINVGTISGGIATNVVPDHASIGVDVRISNMEEAHRIDAFFRNIKPIDPGARISVSGGINRFPMKKNRKTEAALVRVREIGESLGIRIEDVSVGGGSDGNILSLFNMAILDGMGAVGSGAHSDAEYVNTSSIPSRSALLAMVLTKLCQDHIEA
ncbi:glutamate carboxypeptidase [Thermoplasmatales archaeon]|nr:glutamate carboxypeptidase [Thermoplasmatales archaeon]